MAFDEDTIQTRFDRIDVSVFGRAAFGEAVVVNIGGELVVGCDSNGVLHQPVGRGQPTLLDRLLDSEHNRYVWLLTHPHYDHVQGVRGLSEKLDDRLLRVAVPLEYTERDAWPAVRQALTDAWDPADLGPMLAADELQETLETWVGRADAESRVKPALKDVIVLSGRLQFSGGLTRDTSVTVLSPSWVRVRRLAHEAARAAAVRSVEGMRLGRANANVASAVYAVQVGSFGVLLAGDADAEDVALALGELRERGVSTLCYKVSHHGSLSGFSRAVCSELASYEESHALLCPFRSRRLPSEDVASALQKCTTSLHICGPSSEVTSGAGAAESLVPDWMLGWTLSAFVSDDGVRVSVQRPSLDLLAGVHQGS